VLLGEVMEDDVSYFAGRACEEREAALRCSNLKARQAHLGMAARYDDLATAIQARELSLALDLGLVVAL
jgi:hypothetical protein